ncbi:hypothetical protein EPR50_G00124670 [Perca flavescens]|uniref:Uncharacterized protein n=1 Tax=Perca flavescens TaxID=8167 RepID=A0A484CPX0_PERFV|nr:hypothetical protein EPR50_G00124670 [Perca flavescens]
MTQREKPTAMEPQRPKDADVIHTRYRMKKAATTNNEATGNYIQTPVVPPRPTEQKLNATTRYSQLRKVQAEDTLSQSEVPKDKVDSKQSDQSVLAGLFRGSQKEKTPSFTSYLIQDKEEKSANVPAKQAPGSKPASSELSPDPSAEETGSEKEQEKNAEPKQEKGGIFSGMFKKSLKPPKAAQTDEPEKGGLLSGILKKSPKLSEAPRLEEGKGGLFSGLLRKTPQTTGEAILSAQKDLSASYDSLSEAANTKEKGGASSGLFQKPSRRADGPPTEEETQSHVDELSGSSDALNTKIDSPDRELLTSTDNLPENKQEKGGGLFSRLLKKTPKASGESTESPEREVPKEQSVSNDSLSENNTMKEKTIFSNIFKKPQKPAEGAAADKELEVNREKRLSVSCENLSDTTIPKEKKGGLRGIFKKSASTDNLFDEESNEDEELSASWENLLEANTYKEKTGGLAGIFKRSYKPAARSIANEDPLSDTLELSTSCGSLAETAEESEDMEAPEGGGLRRRRTISKKRQVVSFRVKKTLPKIQKLDLPSQSSDKMPVIEEAVELQELNRAQESTVEVQTLEMAAYPTEDNPLESEENDDLMEWWNTVKGWAEWNETSNFHEDDEQMSMEQAADRVYMAARLFVRLFNKRGASLQRGILELLALADAADDFHKKTVKAAVGGGVASVAGSLTTITGLILAPFTFGASIIVTAVGISVATAGSITSATANITDTVHSNMDRKKLEKMIQSYQEEISDIRECLEFVQAGMDTLQEWDFEKYSKSVAKKALNHNLRHVMKEGGMAGKALLVNTNKLVSTVQVLGAAGGVAKAAQAISITTGVISALFLALDIFFLAKDSHKLRKGAKTKFATKIREVCKELQDGLLELNKVKTQLQKTMDGIEVEEVEVEVEVEVEEEVEEEVDDDPRKLAELEQELDLLEEQLDRKVEEEQKSKDMGKEHLKSKKKKKEKSVKEKEEQEEKKDQEEMADKVAKTEGKKKSKKGKGEGESKIESKLEKISEEEKEQNNETVKEAKEDVLKEQSQTGKKKDKETENRKQDQAKEDNCTNKKTDEKEKEKKKTGKELCPVTATGREEWERERGSCREESDLKRSHRRRGTARHDDHREKGGEEQESRSERRRFDRAGGEEERGKRKEGGERRGSDRGREQEHGHRGSVRGSMALLEDGLYI